MKFVHRPLGCCVIRCLGVGLFPDVFASSSSPISLHRRHVFACVLNALNFVQWLPCCLAVLFGVSPDVFASEVLADVFASTPFALPFRRLISLHLRRVRRVRRSGLRVLHMLPEQSLLLCKIATLPIFIARWVASLWDHFRNASGLDLLNPATARSCFSGWFTTSHSTDFDVRNSSVCYLVSQVSSSVVSSSTMMTSSR